MQIRHMAVITLALIGCGSQRGGPTSRELRDRLAVELPGFVRTSSFSVEASQNIGSEVEPVFKSRFKAEIELQTPTYSVDGTDPEALFVKSVTRAGEKRTIYGIATSTLVAGAWRTAFQYENNPLSVIGNPIDFFQSNRVIIRGSPEEQQFNQNRRQQELEREQTRLRSVQSLVGRAVPGSALVDGSNNVVFPITLTLVSFDPTTGRVSGEVGWPSLRGVVKTFEGQLSGEHITATETNWKTRPEDISGILLGIVYTLTLDSSGRLSSGRWQHPGARGGAINF